MNNVNLTDRIAKMMKESRYQSSKSQDYVAKCLGISKKTIQNWESGMASPNFRAIVEWFEALGVPMYPYIMSLLYPKEIEGITAGSDMKDIRMALHTYIDELDDLHVRELLFLLYGSHGSSPTGTMDVITAYLHLPMLMRVCITDNIVTNYEMAESLNLIKDEEHVLPCKSTIEKYVKTAKDAVIHGKECYILTEGEEE